MFPIISKLWRWTGDIQQNHFASLKQLGVIDDQFPIVSLRFSVSDFCLEYTLFGVFEFLME
jgi:hypothetical protein